MFLPHPYSPNSFCLWPRSYEKPIDLISSEANRVPFVGQAIDLESWSDSLRAWPNPPEGWIIWYNRMADAYQPLWESIRTADALSLSLSPLEKDENLLKTIGYFWSDALNCFLFGHGPMTPTLLEVMMITGLDISSTCPSAYRLFVVPFKLSSKAECTNWSTYLSQHQKTKGLVIEKEHTAFLNLWLEHFLFCGPSLAPTKNYLPLAYELAKSQTIGLGKLFLGEIYRYLHLMSLSLLSQKKLRTGGPWWFIQLWAHLYFQSSIPNFPSLVGNSFPDLSGRQIRCTSFGQALYSLPGGKPNPPDASRWFRIFYKGLDNPNFLPYADSELFENPATFQLADFAYDADTRRLYSVMVRPYLLPVGMSTSNRIIKPGYEFYQPVIAARQFGLRQVPPHFLLHFLTSNRVDLPDAVTTQRCYSLFSDLSILVPADLVFTSSIVEFEVWWSMWKTHVFRKAFGLMLQQIHSEYEIPDGEVLLLIQCPSFSTLLNPF
jgi:hypothetical protein